MAVGESMNHARASTMAEAASEEGGENGTPIGKIISHLKDVEGCVNAVEKMSSRKLNNEQCDYLKDKLKLVFQSASSYLEVSRGIRHLSFADIERYRGSRSHIDSVRRVEVFELLLAMAEQIESFVKGCCEDAWIKGAMTLSNVSEYVSSLGFNLELCRVACTERGESDSLTLEEVHGIFEAEFQIVKEKASVDEVTLRSKVLELSGDNEELISHLRRRISMNQPDSAISSPPTAPRDQTSTANSLGAMGVFKKFIGRGKSMVTGTQDGHIIGKGASGEVRMVDWLEMKVAQKIIEGGVHEQFKKEVRILETLCHPYVISFFHSAADTSRCSIFMEWMSSDLHRLITKLKGDDSRSLPPEGPFTHLEAVDLMLQVGQGVKYLHDQKIVHMDLKSYNVLIRRIKEDSKRRYFQAKVTDFGLSETKAKSVCFSDQVYNLGTNRWMPPEIVKFIAGGDDASSKETNRGKVPKKGDVYSFAMVCCEILTGNLPFHMVNEVEAKKKAQRGDRPDLPKECPPKLRLLIERCWSQDPLERPDFDIICKELKYLKYLLMTDIVTFDTSTYENGLLSYGGDFLVDRPIARSLEHPCIFNQMMDRVRHRLEPFPVIGDDGAFDFEDPSDSSVELSSLETLVELLIRSDVIVQNALFQTLLEERSAIPIVVPHNEDFNDFRHLLEALSFVEVKLEDEEILSIAVNKSLPRVVFISNRQTVSQRECAHMACEVMNCQFPSKDIKKDIGGGPTILELGVGFLTNSADKRGLHTNSVDKQVLHCLVFCVSGDHNKLGKVLEKIADVVIIETDSGTEPAIPSWVRGIEGEDDTLFWNTDSQRTSSSKSPLHVWGPFNNLPKRITRYLLGTKKFRGKGSDGSLSLAECFRPINPLHRPTRVSNVEKLEEIGFDNVRDSLTLQKCYNVEASHFFLSLRERWRSPELQTKMQKCQEDRKRLSDDILKLPILEYFVQILSEKERTKRCVSILHFQYFIDQKLKTKLEQASKKVIEAFEGTQVDRKNVALKKVYEEAMNDHVNQMLGLEHLWRELSHIFGADPKRREDLPRLAALHLLDGFPLEIFDGDATIFYKEWVDTVLIDLHSQLKASLKREPKVFVLSVVGVQSSGKSTLLNTMFGTKLKTSAGVCTRGVFLQLVKSEREGFDYVLILDTEGLRAPEFFGREDSQGQDNRLATFAILPADACIVMVANEDDNGLKEVLPMVMLAFKGSKVAELRGGKIQSKLFFVYRGVDVNDKAKLGKNQRKLQEDLATASTAIENFRISETSNQGENTGSDGISPLSTFQVNSDEQYSDVKFFGNLKTGSRPPKDTPEWEYGSKVEELREYIHQRVLESGRWSAHGLLQWKDYLDLVWLSITEANFELSFASHIDHANYHILQTLIATSRQTVGRECQREFEQLTKKLSEGGNIDQLDLGPHSGDLKLRIESIIDTEEIKVSNLLEQRQFQKWRIAEEEKWKSEREDLKKQWLDKLREYVDGTIRFDNLVRDYITTIQLEISAAGRTRDPEFTSPARMTNMEEDFGRLFGRFVEEAKLKHPPRADKVEESIFELYSRNEVLGRKFGFVDNLKAAAYRGVSPVFKLFGLEPVKTKLQELHQSVLSALQDVKQYSNHVVEEIMYLTWQYAKDEGREVQEDMHKLVKDVLVRKLTDIQRVWDSHHNVARRLEAHREFLWESFVNHANKLDATEMLCKALCTLLGADKLLDGFKVSIAKAVSNSLQTREEWVCNWKVMRAHLDLHLIELINSEQTQEMLDLASDGARHYKLVIEKLIRKEIRNHLKHDWTHFTRSICNAIERAATEARHCNSGGSKRPVIFQQSIIRHLNDLSEVLARGVFVTLSTEVCSQYSNDIDFELIRANVSASVNEVHLDEINFPFDEVIEMVRTRLNESNTSSARARCDVMCPHCKLTCFKPMGHSDLVHDTLHQPQGLCGWCGSFSLELRHESCSKSVQLERKFWVNRGDDKERVPYSEWTKIYPDWVLPSEQIGSVEVREYIFAHFQKELVQRGDSRTKECTTIPTEYSQHSLQTLQLNLENIVRSGQHHM